MTQKNIITAALFILLAGLGLGGPASAQTAPESNPANPNEIRETFNDWNVGCIVHQGVRRCAMSQQQTNPQSKQRVLVIEMHLVKTGMEGNLVLPFGLSLASGVTLGVDAEPAGQSHPFATCLPVGCVVPLNFDEAMVAALRKGSKLNVQATTHQGKRSLTLAVSLSGFSAANNRLNELAN